MYEEDYNEAEDDQIINEEYKIWKKNTPYLYDLIITNGLEWPSLTVNWLPTIVNPDKSPFSVQKLILGTHTSNDEPNHLMIMKVRLPNNEIQGSDVKDSNIAGYSKLENKIELETRITHQGDVNKARAMPQKHNIIATKTQSGEVHVFDYFKHPPKPADNVCRPEMRLLGHTKEGYGLSWSTKREGCLLSGSDDHKVCMWDINSNCSSLNPLRTFEEHKGIVEDVNWHKFSETMFASAGDDRKLILWDLKQEKPIWNIEAHSQEINSVEFNYFNEFHLLTASNDKTIVLWDLRKMTEKIHTFAHHRGDVMAAKWNPNIESLFASYSADRRVNVWDLSKLGRSQSVTDAEDGPVELLFTHGGHTAKISDLDWNPKQHLMCASVAEDNILHIWEMANSIYYDNDNEDNDRMRVDN